MKLRLFVFLFLASALLFGMSTAHAACLATSIAFPPPNSGHNFVVKSGACITDPNSGARLRWDDNNSGELQLFDTDGGGNLLWCAHNSAGSCARGASLCLQEDGNMVIYTGANCAGSPVFASNTRGQNEDGEELSVGELTINGVKEGEIALITNDNDFGSDTGSKLIWRSNNTDPS